MSLLTIIQSVADQLGIQQISSVIGNSGATERQLLAIANDVGKEIRDSYKWAESRKEYTYDLVADQAAYAFPTDFNRFHFETDWSRDEQWQLFGPLTPQEWQALKSGINPSGPRQRFTIKGYADTQYYIDPTPAAGDAGKTFVFEYVSKTWILPKTWTTGDSFSASDYCSYNGNIYQTTAGGTTGSTAPTHTSGSASDGGVTWTYISAAYEKFQNDNDNPIFDERLVEMGIKAHYNKRKGFDWQQDMQDYLNYMRLRSTAKKGAKTLSLTGWSHQPYLIGPWNVPDTGYGI